MLFRKNKYFKVLLLLSVICGSFPNVSYGFENIEKDDYDMMVSIASGRSIEKEKAAAVVSIITKEEIEKIGAFSIEEVLETVPGLHVKKNSYIRSNTYVFRGIGEKYNQEALFLIDGVPMKIISSGNRSQAGFAGMSVDNIEKIEVVRGPGSALYGADAYAGVINIITKNKNNAEIKGRVGDLNEEYYAFQKGNGDYYMSFNYRKTEENDSIVEYDEQSYYDTLFSTDSSLAPTSPNFNLESYDFLIKGNDLNNFSFYAYYQKRNNLGVGFGANDVIDKNASFDNERLISKIDYDQEYQNLSLNFNVSYYLMKESSEEFIKFYPDGAFGGLFPNGVISTPERTEDTLSFNYNSIYRGLENHYLQVGFGYSKSRIYDIKEYKNFNMDMTPKQEGLIEVSDNLDEVYLTPRGRENYYAYIQDEYYIKKDWILTSGVRYDYNNDFGESINPRIAVVWNKNQETTLKFLYGRAYRAPSFSELYVKSNPIALGNEELSPETIDTYEISINRKFLLENEFNFNIFYYKKANKITTTPVSNGIYKFDNLDGGTGYGFEAELLFYLNSNVSLYTNYSYQNSGEKENENTHPSHLLYTRLSYVGEKWDFNIQNNWVSERERVASDLRDALNGYNKMDLNVKRKNILDIKGLNAKLYVKNLTDEDVREPSVIGGMKNDYPMPGRNAHIEFSYQF